MAKTIYKHKQYAQVKSCSESVRYNKGKRGPLNVQIQVSTVCADEIAVDRERSPSSIFFLIPTPFSA
ncbi:hypothetical protein OUZ56_011142 [Daphnia magna]|uniref:Uncharacterized protein n=1 Tax=Daphnia magna TaxID=35525 RepID=A0ABQ9YZC9_9CRUS|nr:hypothetical protein OUZ56_011142 [Daphnia magna]